MADQLQQAIDSGNITLVKELIGKYGSKILTDYIEWDDPRKESPVHRAINQNRTEVCLFLLQQKKSSNFLKHPDFRGETPLHRCGWCGREEIAKKLIKLGAKVNSVNALGLTPLHLAAERGKLDVVELLIASKADVNAKSNQGNTPLHRATTSGHKELIVTLIKANASPDIVNNKGVRAGGKYTSAQLLQRAESKESIGGGSKKGGGGGGGTGTGRYTTTVTTKNQQYVDNPSSKEELRYDVEAASIPGMDRKYYYISPSRVVYGQKLGEGGFGTVYEGTVAGQPVALKQLTSSHNRVHENFRKELDVMCKLRHPNIVLLLGAVIEPDQLCLVMEICRGGSLTSLLKHRHLAINEVVIIVRHIAMAMNWLHSRNPPILHLDLKPANILLTDTESLHVKVSDFGLARPSNSDSRAIVGTRRFMAPEMMRKAPVNESADVYSFGILLWQIYTRKKPFSPYKTLKTQQEKNDFAEAVWSGYRPPISLSMPPFLAHLMTSCWSTNPEHRPTFTQVIQWLDQIMLHNTFTDRSAQVFWDISTSSSADITTIRWNQFEDNMILRLDEEGIDHEDISFDEVKLLLCDRDGRETVSMTHFTNISNCFGPFYPLERFIEQVSSLVNLTWITYDCDDKYPLYFPFIDQNSAIALLAGRPAGTFLLRNSKSMSVANPFVLSYVYDSSTINHIQIFYNSKKKNYRAEDIESSCLEILSKFIVSPDFIGKFSLRYSTHKDTDFTY